MSGFQQISSGKIVGGKFKNKNQIRQSHFGFRPSFFLVVVV